MFGSQQMYMVGHKHNHAAATADRFRPVALPISLDCFRLDNVGTSSVHEANGVKIKWLATYCGVCVGNFEALQLVETVDICPSRPHLSLFYRGEAETT